MFITANPSNSALFMTLIHCLFNTVCYNLHTYFMLLKVKTALTTKCQERKISGLDLLAINKPAPCSLDTITNYASIFKSALYVESQI